MWDFGHRRAGGIFQNVLSKIWRRARRAAWSSVHYRPEAFVKKYIRDMIDDLRRSKKNRNFIPPIPRAPEGGKTIDFQPPPEPPVPQDLNNQILSDDPLERARQLDYQFQKRQLLP